MIALLVEAHGTRIESAQTDPTIAIIHDAVQVEIAVVSSQRTLPSDLPYFVAVLVSDCRALVGSASSPSVASPSRSDLKILMDGGPGRLPQRILISLSSNRINALESC
jgi:hypothetical protein